MAAPAEKSVLETIFEDGEAGDDDGFFAEDVEMIDAETLEDSGFRSPRKTSPAGTQPIAGGGEGDDDDVPKRRASQRGNGDGRKKKKKRRRNKKKQEQQPPSEACITDINRFVISTCRHLKEKKSYLVWSAVGCLGVSAVNDLVKEPNLLSVEGSRRDKKANIPCEIPGIPISRTVELERDIYQAMKVDAIWSCGGQKTADGKRFRSGGGILWNILKTREPKAYKEIMAKGREFEKQFRPSRAMRKMEGNEAAVVPTGPCETDRSKQQNSEGSQHPQEHPPVPEQPDPKEETERKPVLTRIRAPVSYNDLFEEGEIV